jgi:hypothetical protein
MVRLGFFSILTLRLSLARVDACTTCLHIQQIKYNIHMYIHTGTHAHVISFRGWMNKTHIYTHVYIYIYTYIYTHTQTNNTHGNIRRPILKQKFDQKTHIYIHIYIYTHTDTYADLFSNRSSISFAAPLSPMLFLARYSVCREGLNAP